MAGNKGIQLRSHLQPLLHGEGPEGDAYRLCQLPEALVQAAQAGGELDDFPGGWAVVIGGYRGLVDVEEVEVHADPGTDQEIEYK